MLLPHRRFDAGELKSSEHYGWRKLANVLARDRGRRVVLTPPCGVPQELSLERLDERDPEQTLVRLGVHCVPRWLYERERQKGRSAFGNEG